VAVVYTASMRVRHHELDPYGRVHPAVYLRWLAQVAIDASTDAGFDAAWYAGAGAHWLVRRTAFSVPHPARVDDVLTVATWVDDVRRVRSHRSYEARTADGVLCVAARTDWVFVDEATGRPRRVPPEMYTGFGIDPTAPHAERPEWTAPAPPPAPASTPYQVSYADLDSLGHVNNATYLDLVADAALGVLSDVGWPLDRLAAGGAVPWLAEGELEYLDAARHRDRLDVLTWFGPGTEALETHQLLVRADDGRPLVRAGTRWRWADPATAEPAAAPAPLAAALRPLLAA
jgi:YbgC/YbaW family acyl-CoA thioester hydrolase